MPRPTLEKLLSRTLPTPTKAGTCLRWQGGLCGAGYASVGWSEDGIPQRRDAHRLVMELMLERQLSRDEWVLHRCDNPWCINPEHLRVGTAKENQQESWAKGRAGCRSRPGGQNGRAKITEQIVREIRATALPLREVAARLGIHWATAYKIRARKLWSHLA